MLRGDYSLVFPLMWLSCVDTSITCFLHVSRFLTFDFHIILLIYFF